MDKESNEQKPAILKVPCMKCFKYTTLSAYDSDCKDFFETDKSAKECFPYMSLEDLQILNTGLCKECLEKKYSGGEK